MTISLDSLAAEVAALRVLNGRDECDLTSAELHDFHDGLGRIRKSYDAVAATMAGEVTRRSAPELGAGGLARREGFSNPQQYLANTLGTTPTEANKLIDASRALAPHVGGQDDLLGATRLEDGRDPDTGIDPDIAPPRRRCSPTSRTHCTRAPLVRMPQQSSLGRSSRSRTPTQKRTRRVLRAMTAMWSGRPPRRYVTSVDESSRSSKSASWRRRAPSLLLTYARPANVIGRGASPKNLR